VRARGPAHDGADDVVEDADHAPTVRPNEDRVNLMEGLVRVAFGPEHAGRPSTCPSASPAGTMHGVPPLHSRGKATRYGPPPNLRFDRVRRARRRAVLCPVRMVCASDGRLVGGEASSTTKFVVRLDIRRTKS
jgi:hypothetical protein